MKKVILTLYSFDELSEQAKKKVFIQLADINTEGNWYENVYEDAETIGLTIKGFDLEYMRERCEGEFKTYPLTTAQLILDNHGEQTKTYELAAEFKAKHSDMSEPNSTACDGDFMHLDSWFLRELLNEYAQILKRDLADRLSEEAIKETVTINEYTFEQDGTLNNGNNKDEQEEFKILITIDGGIVQSVATNFEAKVVTVDFDDIGDEPVVVSGPNKQDIFIPQGKLFYKEMCKEESDMTKDEKVAKQKLKDINF